MQQVAQSQQEAAAEAAAEVAEQVMADQQAATLQTQQMLRQLRQELRQQLPGTAADQSQALQRLEAKLSALEGSVLSAGSVAREAAMAAAQAGSSLSGDARDQLEQASLGVARELRGELQRSQSDTSRALSQIQPRLQAMEGAMVGLQEAQVESMRRLTAGLTDAIGEAQLTLQAAVRAEAHASLEPVRRLPQVLAAALPLTDVTIGQVAQAGPLECALSSGERDWLQTTMKQQLEAASEQIIASQAQELTGLKDTRRSLPDAANEIRSSLAPQLARINRGLQELTAFQADVGGRMDNRAVLQRLDILQSSFESAVEQVAAAQPAGSRQGSSSPASDPAFQATVQTLEQSVTSLLDQVEDGRDASLELAEETAALREQIQSMQQPQPPSSLQEAADGPVVQEAVLALARAVQQLEGRSLSRLDDLGAQLRLVGPLSQPDSSGPSTSGAAPETGSGDEVTAGTSGWAASMSHAADISGRLAQQVAQTSASAPQAEQGPGLARSKLEEAAGLQELQQLLQNNPESEGRDSLLSPSSDSWPDTQQQQPGGSSQADAAGSRSVTSPRKRDSRSLPKWLQPSPDLNQAASNPASDRAMSASQMLSDKQLQEQLQQRLRSSGAELDGRSNRQDADRDQQASFSEQEAMQPSDRRESQPSSDPAFQNAPSPSNTADAGTKDAAFQRMQALLTSQYGSSGSVSTSINDAKAEPTPSSLPSFTTEALEVADRQSSRPGYSEGSEHTPPEAAERGGEGISEGRSQQAEPSDGSRQGKDFASWLAGHSSNASPLLVDELLFAAGQAAGPADESQRQPGQLLDGTSRLPDQSFTDENSSPSDAATADRRTGIQQSGLSWNGADEPVEASVSPISTDLNSTAASASSAVSTRALQQNDLPSPGSQSRLCQPLQQQQASQTQQGDSAASMSMQSELSQQGSIEPTPRPGRLSQADFIAEQDGPLSPTADDAAQGLPARGPSKGHLSPWDRSMADSRAGSEANSTYLDAAADSSSAFQSNGYNRNSPDEYPMTESESRRPGSKVRDPWGMPNANEDSRGGVQQGTEGPGRAEMQEGKRLLAEGRARRREGLAWGEADRALAAACASFQTAAKATPNQASILGNWGNALMEYGQLKADYRDSVASTPTATLEEEQALLDASKNLRCEAIDLLRLAGRRYKRAFEIAEDADRRNDSNRALQNWMQSIILRAGLAAEPQEARRLYENACEKAKALLEDEPQNVTAWRAHGQGLLQLGLLLRSSETDRAQAYLQDAEACLLSALDLGQDDPAMEVEVQAQLQQLQDLQNQRSDVLTPSYAAL
ncbi:hypothetical protein WJX74_001810 [Apatococcus lobatus]|uniref:Uncharacterized protein n=2 Tax=Apatococcus TaxID=904362 RepID=A0AAW1RA65_9CHLO